MKENLIKILSFLNKPSSDGSRFYQTSQDIAEELNIPESDAKELLEYLAKRDEVKELNELGARTVYSIKLKGKFSLESNDREQMIKDEAKRFHEDYLHDIYRDGRNAFQKVKEKLTDFYVPIEQATFLKEIHSIVLEELQEHRVERHEGKRDPSCHIEQEVERFIFFLEQEQDTLPYIPTTEVLNDKTVKREGVFISYSHVDSEYRKEVEKFFKPFKKSISVWTDSKIEPGQLWKEEIKKGLQQAKIGILLISQDFLASDFIQDEEIPPLLEAAKNEGGKIFSVILRPCSFDLFPQLSQFQAFNRPSDPVVKMENYRREELWVNLVSTTMRVLNESS